MIRTRVMPCLLLNESGLIKTVKFKSPTYIGDPINTVKLFNEKEVDELIILDTSATINKRNPSLKVISELASECFMPLCYGGGIRSINDMKEIYKLGVEKISINSYAIENPEFIRQASEYFGSQSVIVSVDVKKNIFGKYEMYTHSGKQKVKRDFVEFIVEMERLGAGEILLNSIDRDGTMQGFDLELIKKVSGKIKLPLIACGGAGNIGHLSEAMKQGGASAVAAGSMFIYQGPHKAVLINYPQPEQIERL